MLELDKIDQQAASCLDGYLVRKDLVRNFCREFPVPSYVVEFLIGRYCASTDMNEIKEGLDIVEKQLRTRTIRAGEDELFKARAREENTVKIIDLITARLDAKTDSYVATLPSLRLNDVRISSELVKNHERMLTGGFYSEITLNYDAAIALESKGRPFGIEFLREIQLSKRNALEILSDARKAFSLEDWKIFLLRSIGIEAESLNQRQKDSLFIRMIPFVERNYNLIELGPRGTGKSHLFQQISPYAHLVSGGKATVAKMFVNNANNQRGLLCLYDVVCFDEISGISFDQKDGVNILKGYMESGEFSRGKESIRAEGSVVLVGNFHVDVEHQQRVGHLFSPLPPEIRDDTAFMDRIHAFLPGWDVPKIDKNILTNHFGLVSDFLSECWNHLRFQNNLKLVRDRVNFGSALSGRDANAVNKTISGLLKLINPGNSEISDEEIEWAVHLAMEARRRVKEQQKRIGIAEFRNTKFSYTMSDEGIEKYVLTPELHSENSISSDPLEPGQVWTLSPEGEHTGLFRIETKAGPGSGIKILNKPIPPAFNESMGYAEQNLYANSDSLVGDKDPRKHEFTVQLRAFDTVKSGAKLGMASLIALCSALIFQSLKGGLVIVGELTLGGSLESIHNPVALVEFAVEKGASIILVPVSCRRQLIDLSDEMATKIDIQYYKDSSDLFIKALQSE